MRSAASSQMPVRKADDHEVEDLPPLNKDPITIHFIAAVFNGAIDEDIRTKEGDIIKSLVTLFNIEQKSLDAEAKRFLLPFLVHISKELRRSIPRFTAAAVILIQQGVEAGYFLTMPSMPFEYKKSVIEAGANVNYTNKGYSVLHALVTSCGHFHFEENVEFLLARNLNPNSCHEKYGSALHLAIANENFKPGVRHSQAKALIERFSKYADYNWNLTDSENKTVLCIAAKMRATEIVTVILQLKTKGKQIDVNIPDTNGRTPLHFSCALGDLESVNALLAAGADINAVDTLNRTPLHYAVMREKIVRKILIEIMIDPDRDKWAFSNNIVDVDYEPVYDESNDQLHTLRAIKGPPEVMLPKILAKIQMMNYSAPSLRQFDIDFMRVQCQLSGISFIQNCKEGQPDVVLCLLSHDADITMKNKNGNTAEAIATRDADNQNKSVTELDRIAAQKSLEHLKSYSYQRDDQYFCKR